MPGTETPKWAFRLVALTWALLVFGSTVRVHGAGLACPDWPLCFGQVVPAYDFKVYLEFGHRVVAGAVSLGFLGLAAQLARAGAFARSAALRALVPLAALVLAVQVVLGGLTVLELLAEWTVSSHLLAGNTFCTLLLLIALATRELVAPRAREAVTASQRAVPVLLAAAVLAQLVLGGLVSSSFAGLACGTWPSCNGAGWFPTFEGAVGLQVVHRLTAYGIGLLAIANVGIQWRSSARRAALLTLGLVTVQVGIGVANVLLRLPAEVTLLHSGTAALLLLSVGALAHEVFAAPLAVGAVAASPRPMEAA